MPILTLKSIVDDNLRVPVKDLGLPDGKSLARETQIRLIALGILDPPDDGAFGPVSRLALATFQRLRKAGASDTIDGPMAEALLGDGSSVLAALKPGSDFAGRIVKTMQLRNYWIARVPGYRNIVYVEGANADGSANDDKPNRFNDQRIVFEVDKNGKPTILDQWEATTEPGSFFTFNPLNSKGAARIALAQFKSWAVGTHMAGRPSGHEALVQVADVRVHRDLNKDFVRDGDLEFVGSGFGINQHWGFDLPVSDIGQASAGCLVGRTKAGHRAFMKLAKEDPRFLASHGYRFISTVLHVTQLV